MKYGDGLPIVEAVAETSSNDGVYFVDLPVASADVRFEVQGSPPQISVVYMDCPVADKLTVGHYVHGIVMPEIEIVSLADPVHLQSLIQANAANPRRLMISSSPFYVDTVVRSSVSGAIYKHTLPASSSLGFGMRGFPPFIAVVAPTSPLAGRIHQGQTVEALLVPGQPILNLASGGFTSNRVEERLLKTCQIQGRQLVVKDEQTMKREKGSSRAFDDCTIS